MFRTEARRRSKPLERRLSQAIRGGVALSTRKTCACGRKKLTEHSLKWKLNDFLSSVDFRLCGSAREWDPSVGGCVRRMRNCQD